MAHRFRMGLRPDETGPGSVSSGGRVDRGAVSTIALPRPTHSLAAAPIERIIENLPQMNACTLTRFRR
jgi:hypothetical protein